MTAMDKTVEIRTYEETTRIVRTYDPRLYRWVQRQVRDYTPTTAHVPVDQVITPEPEPKTRARTMNQNRVRRVEYAYAILRKHGPMTLTELAGYLDCSRKTVGDLVRIDPQIIRLGNRGNQYVVGLVGQTADETDRYPPSVPRIRDLLQKHGPLPAYRIAEMIQVDTSHISRYLCNHSELFQVTDVIKPPTGGRRYLWGVAE